MLVINDAMPCAGQSYSLQKAVDAGRATPVAANSGDKLALCSSPVPCAVAAFDHGVDAVSAFLNLNIPDRPGMNSAGAPEINWPEATPLAAVPQ